MTDDRQRLRALELRTEDVVLLRVLVGIALRIIGGLLVLSAMSQTFLWVSLYVQSRSGRRSLLDLVLTFGQPTVYACAGIAVFVLATAIARRLVPHALAKPGCPACGYNITSLANGRCPECGYEVSPLRDGPLSAMDRLLLARSAIAAAMRLLGIVLVGLGIARFALEGLSDLILGAGTYGNQYRSDRELLWGIILVVVGMTVYALAEKLAGVAMRGIARHVERPSEADEDG